MRPALEEFVPRGATDVGHSGEAFPPVSTPSFVAVDLGAASCRVLLGRCDGDRITMADVARFDHRPVMLNDGLHWDILRLLEGVKEGVGGAATRAANTVKSVGIDSWGVDFGLLDRNGGLISNPYSYRDSRTAGMIERALDRAPKSEIYRTTGIQFMPINTLYQLLAMEDSPALELAEHLLLIPDLIRYWLTGTIATERTIATTTQLCDAQSGEWSDHLLARLRIPRHLFPELIPPGMAYDPMLSDIADDMGIARDIPIVAVASHDTASAIVAVPAAGPDFAYISSGTWSLVGLETSRPILTAEAMTANFTNEGGFAGTTRFLKNVMGLWLLQECRRMWSRKSGHEVLYETLIRSAESSAPFGPLIDPDDPRFLAPGDMPSRIRVLCKATGQRPPERQGEIVRCILESLAFKYRWVLEQAERLSGRHVEVIHVVGGGGRNHLLCQLTASATGRPVMAGPVEATAIGNVMVQAYALGDVGSLTDMRAIIRRSTALRQYDPESNGDEWDTAYRRFRSLVEANPEAAVGRVMVDGEAARVEPTRVYMRSPDLET